mgnify:CR=1 FL=1
MRILKVTILVLAATLFSFSTFAKDNSEKKHNKAENVWTLVESMEDQIDEDIVRAEVKSLTLPERVKLAKMCVKDARNAVENGQTASVGLYILAIFIQPLAVGLGNGISKEFWIDLVLTILGWLPGIIYAFIVL